MLVGVIDVGANTVRLQVSRGKLNVHRSKAMLRLGESIEEYDRLPEDKLDETAAVVGRFADEARRHGVRRLEVLVTSPGRQAANGDELIPRLARSAAAPVRILDAAEEGRLAFVGATSLSRGPSRRRIAVVDVGGGSAQIAVGTRRDGPAWVRSLEIGSMRLTSRIGFADPPGLEALATARTEVLRHLDGVTPPLPTQPSRWAAAPARSSRSRAQNSGRLSSSTSSRCSPRLRRGRSSNGMPSSRTASARSLRER